MARRRQPGRRLALPVPGRQQLPFGADVVPGEGPDLPVEPLVRQGEAQLQAGDLSLHAHYQVCRFREHHWPPALALVIEETLPTGRYDRLGNHPGDGLGAGTYATTFGLYATRDFVRSSFFA